MKLLSPLFAPTPTTTTRKVYCCQTGSFCFLLFPPTTHVYSWRESGEGEEEERKHLELTIKYIQRKSAPGKKLVGTCT